MSAIPTLSLYRSRCPAVKGREYEEKLFFLDPPYWNISRYKHDFLEQDFVELAELLNNIEGKILGDKQRHT
jgi:site-specific DNA-adenine methylase